MERLSTTVQMHGAEKMTCTQPAEHPAVTAWRKLHPNCIEPAYIETIKNKRKSTVYRLEGAGSGHSDVIAKRCFQHKALVERTIYEDVLPCLPVTAPRYYGFVEEDEVSGDHRYCWLFLECTGGQKYSSSLAEHRTLAARWLGAMHTVAANPGARMKAYLPDRGPEHYRQQVQTAKATIPQVRANPRLTADDHYVLQQILSTCEYLQSHWNQRKVL